MSYADKGALEATAVIFAVLPVVAVGLRFYARSISNAKLGIDDWLMIPAMVGFIHVRRSWLSDRYLDTLYCAGNHPNYRYVNCFPNRVEERRVTLYLGAQIGEIGAHEKLGPHGEPVMDQGLVNYEKVPLLTSKEGRAAITNICLPVC